MTLPANLSSDPNRSSQPPAVAGELNGFIQFEDISSIEVCSKDGDELIDNHSLYHSEMGEAFFYNQDELKKKKDEAGNSATPIMKFTAK